MKKKFQVFLEKPLAYFKEHGKHVSTFLFIVGFIIDFIFLPSISHPLTPYIGIFYCCGFAIALLSRSYLLTKGKGDVFSNKISSLLSVLMAFFSGSLLSYIFVLYYRSSYLAGALPFFLFAVFVIFANEYIKSKKYRTYLDVCVLYFTLTALTIFLTPFVLLKVSNEIFIFSLFLAALISLAYSFSLLKVLTPELVQKKSILGLSLWAPIVFAFLYFSESIPPLPISLTDTHVYHSVKKVGNTYEVSEEVKDEMSTAFHVIEGKPLYFFTTIFAPVAISAPIEHVWETYDENNGVWKSVSTVSFNVVGGRDEGYRGYSYTNLTSPGRWRVSVYLDAKRLIGRHYFSVVSFAPKELKEVVR